MEEVNEIALQEIIQILWQKVIVITFATLLGGAIAWSISYYVIQPTYTSRISMYVNSNTEKNNTVANLNDINASQKLVSTYIQILRSDRVLGSVLEVTDLDYTEAELRNNITANAMNNTEIFEVKVTSEDPKEAALIANTIAEVAPAEILRVVKAGSVELIDEAVPATKPTSPQKLLNTMIGGMLGGLLAIVGVLIVAMLDGRIKSEDDLKKNFTYPVIGIIPDLDYAQGRVK